MILRVVIQQRFQTISVLSSALPPLCKAHVVIPAGSEHCHGSSTPQQLLIPCWTPLFLWLILLSPHLTAPKTPGLTWSRALAVVPSSPGHPSLCYMTGSCACFSSWPGGKPSLFCLGDVVGGPVPVIAFPSLLNSCTDRINVKNSSIL